MANNRPVVTFRIFTDNPVLPMGPPTHQKLPLIECYQRPRKHLWGHQHFKVGALPTVKPTLSRRGGTFHTSKSNRVQTLAGSRLIHPRQPLVGV